MIITYIHRIGWFIGLVLLQVLILNSVHIAGYATPFLYIYFILKFSSGTSRNELMLWAFFLPFSVPLCFVCSCPVIIRTALFPLSRRWESVLS